MKLKYEDVFDKDMSQNFKRCYLNDFMREFVLKENGKRCNSCGLQIHTNFKLKYLPADRICKTASSISVPAPTPKYPNKTRKVPNCEKCCRKTPDEFCECAKYLMPIHNSCLF